ncbi:aspartate carbamoyltransferase catalytic subunit [Skermanella mucosa]|uniref:aspartate carbamoyltransferase catalytic subunit n=1 Tax=Skermanella mucosa TaxID=1789672 RepID=UPI00192BCC4A|nr:aspartate carbamoyltransferase catalytic subunit [Skermanella mucosa]UEM23745.1 aspartate carbamoyltransferase catalytic subunit [Skermanella mucosa]
MTIPPRAPGRPRHLLALQGMPAAELTILLDRADDPPTDRPLAGRRVGGLFPADAEPLRAAFETAVLRLGGEASDDLPGCAAALVRHARPGGVPWVASHAPCAIVNAGDGGHEDPVRALADAVEMRRRLGDLRGRVVALAGDILHHGAALSSIHMLNALGAFVRVVAPPTLLPPEIDRLGAEVHHLPGDGLRGADAVIRYPLDAGQSLGTLVPSRREFDEVFEISGKAPLVRTDQATLASAIAACLDHVTREAA